MFKNKKFLFVESILFILLVIFALKIGIKDTYASLNQLGFSNSQWGKLDVTSDGESVAAIREVGGGGYGISKSSDSGVSVIDTGETREWVDIYEAGDKFVAVSNSNGDYIYVSSADMYSSWVPDTSMNAPTGPFVAAAISDNPNDFMIALKNTNYYIKVYGMWQGINNSSGEKWADVAFSEDRQYTLMAASGPGGKIFISDDLGANITDLSLGDDWLKVAMSDSGQYMVALMNAGGFAVFSDNYGVNWATLHGKSNITGIDVSNDGKIVISTSGEGVYYTVDYGESYANWITIDESSEQWTDVKINDQGTKIYASESSGYIYSNDLDVTPATISGGLPSGTITPEEASGASLSVETGENATCKYSTTPGTEYDEMEGTFDTTGELSSNEPLPSVNEGFYTYYVRCLDEFGNKNTSDYEISFTIENDVTPPAVSNPLPNSDLSEGQTSANLQVTTNENATCKFSSTPGEALISGTLFSNTGNTSHSHTLSGLIAGSTNTYYVRCEDSNSNQNSSDTVISFSIPPNVAPEITNISSDKANGTYIVGEEIDIDITFSEDVNSTGLTIYLNTGGQCSTGSITNSNTATCNYSVQSGENTSDLTVSSVSGSITDSAGNSNSSFDLSGLNLADNKDIVIDTAAPVRSGGYPSGVQTIQTTTDIEIGLTTDETATCKYSTTPGTSYGDMTSFTTTNGTTHTYLVENVSDGNSYTYYVRCSDNYGHENNTDYEISFSAQEQLADSSPPTITSVSSDKSNGTYTVGEVIDIDVTFSETVSSFGDVTVTLETGDTDRTCEFSLSNETTGTCNYTVQAGDNTSDLTVSSISGSIDDTSANGMSDFTIPTNLADNKNIVIDTTTPTISSPLPSGTQSQGTTGVTLQVTTDENSTCKYGTAPNTAYASISNTFSTTGGTTHTQSITGLSANTSYTYYVRCTDSLNPTTSDTTISFSIPANPTTEESTEGSSGSGRTGRRNTSSSSSGSESNNAAVQIVDSVVKKTVEKIDSVLTEFKETIVGDPENKPKILELIDKLKEEFNKLFNRLEETQQSESSEETQNILFTQDLELGDSHPEVKLLQQFLNNNGYSIAPSGPGSKGQETEMFGYATRAALARFQRDNSIVPAVGNFGPITRDLINSLLN